MIQAGIDQGAFRPDLNPRFVVQLLVGTVNYQAITQRLVRDLQLDPANQAEAYIDFALDMVLNYIVVEK